MTAEGDTEVEVGNDFSKKRKSLLEKYEIPIDHLDFGYIKSCNNIKEIEKIVKILRSKDEGYYPDLQKCAEDKLRSLNSNHRLLRTDAPVMTKELLSKEEWKSITEDLEDWKGDVSNKEMVLSNTPKCNIKAYPEVRKSSVGLPIEKNEMGSKKTERIKGSDYASWDKFDADTECLKMDLEEKLKEVEKERKALEEKNKPPGEKSLEELALEDIKDSVEHMTQEEREILALKEKNMGNEFFKTNNLNEAIKHYTRSIYMYPTCPGYNNRAATYLKQCKFSKALDDLNNALKHNPKDIKALYRRAIALQHKNKFAEALEDVREVLRKQPNHVIARHLADQLRENCASLPKKHKLRIQDKDHPDDNRVKDVTEEEMLRDYKDVNFIEVNDWGLPKIMCNCNGKYMDEPGIRHEKHVRFQHILSKYPQNSNVTEIKKPQENTKKRNDQETHTAKKLEIVELEKIEEEKIDDSQKKTVTAVEPNKTPRSCLVVDKRVVNATSLQTNVPHDNATGNAQNHELNSTKVNTDLDNKMKPVNIQNNETFMTDEYSEKASDNVKLERKNSKNDKTAKNINIQDADETKIFPNTCLAKRNTTTDCTCGDIANLSSFEILDIWKSKESIKHQANLLRSICPLHLANVIGSKLEVSMVSNLFNCLYNQFDHKSEAEVIKNYCLAITKLNRFSIMMCFMSAEDKKTLNELEKIAGPFLDVNTKKLIS
ncbi:uncharacterized protein LOC106661534 isoform X2 [Cimex lectularius]|uniref:RNA-polymerase II-associated protein 3-like C-terminal domain-containing protein n=1 Tax=Cimex lectularius TaxID=79782 RepID=A0A8I6R7F1_CIMLE|nr:uncharacterized protein LOC106661534 isoform X2 [Cimex lectularius]XP_014240491.1 uncharacterized protein LOC106661534 isoform X2 [Cimex lectularius]